MLIALDVGNSHVKVGGFYGDDLRFVASIATDDRQTGEQYACALKDVFALYRVELDQIDGVVLCSVVPSMHAIIHKAVRFLTQNPILNVSSGVKTGLNIKIDHPRALGSDLVANAVWAMHQAKTPCVVVDIGTVTTFTAIDSSGVLVGTAISAGVGIMLEAIKRNAAQLPTVQLEAPAHGVLGKNTVEAIKAGTIYGAAGLIDGILARYAEVLEAAPHVLLTGGASEVIAPYLTTPAELDPYVTLRGLHLIWKKNRG